MGLADFFAEAGGNAPVGNIARAAGGKTIAQRGFESFVNNELPALLQEIHANTDEKKIPELGSKFMTAAVNAGIPLSGVEKLMEMTIGPALQGIRQDKLNQFREDLRGQEASPRPQGGNDLVKGPDIPAIPGRQIDPEMAVRYGQAVGANPQQMIGLLGTPADIQGKQLSNQKTQAQLDQEKAKESAIQGLPSESTAPGLPSAQAVARINPAGIVQFLPGREDSQAKQDYQNQLLGLKQQGLENTLSMAQQRIGAANDRAGLAESRAEFNKAAELRKEFTSQSKNFQFIRDAYNRMRTAADTPAGGLTVLYNFMKANDPGARVTEQDFRSAATAKPMLERLGLSWDAVSSLWSGSKMTPGMRRDFLARAADLYNAEAQQHQKRVQEYSRLATNQGLNPSNVITDMEATGEAPAAPAPAGQGRYSEGVPSGSAPTGQGQGSGPPPPAPGTIYKGHKFKGGNPADKNNWVKVTP